jgi:hypothetical protein
MASPYHRNGFGADTSGRPRPHPEKHLLDSLHHNEKPVRVAGELEESAVQEEIAGLVALGVHDHSNRGNRPPAFEGAAKGIDQQDPAESPAAKALIDGHPPE